MKLAEVSTPPFYMVYSPKGLTAPKMRHATQEVAEAEAVRLAHANPGKEFYVMRPTCCCTTMSVVVTRFDKGE